jgi:AcrR family transcriptional regulator
MSESSTKPELSGRGHYARSEDTRARVLQAALVEAADAGFQNTSMAKIAGRAGVAVGILNYHFGSKRELLRELMASQLGEFLARLDPPAEHEDFFSYEAIIVVVYLEFLGANPSYVRLAEEVRLHDPELYRRGIGDHIAHIAGRISRGIERGDVRAMQPDEIRAQAYLTLGALTFLDRYLEDEAYPGAADVATFYIRSLRGGLAP